MPGTAVAGYGSAGASSGGLGSAGFLGAAAGSVAGAGAGGAVGYYVGYRSGSVTRGATTGAITGATVGGAVGGPIGMGVGAGVGALAGWYGAVKAGKEVNKIRDAFAASQGSMEAIHARLQAIGREDLFQPFAFGERNVGAIKEAVGNIQEVFEKINKVMQQVGANFGKLNTAAAAYGRTLPASLRAGFKALLENKDLTDEMRANLTELAKDPSWRELEQRAKDLGINLDALGKKFQTDKIHEAALGYVRDLTMFNDAGADMDKVLEGMADELSALYQTAKKNGVSLPETLRPWMEKLAAAGLLVDEAGNKITDLNGIVFDPTVVDQPLVDIKNVLIDIKDLLERQLPDAAKKGVDAMNEEFKRLRPPGAPDSGSAVPRPKPGEGTPPPGEETPPPSSGGAVPRPELALQGGTHGQYVDWGAGTNVTLHGRERVVPAGEAIGGGDGVPIYITVVSTLDGKEVARNQIKHIPRALALAGV
jgi:gas vesicle protein